MTIKMIARLLRGAALKAFLIVTAALSGNIAAAAPDLPPDDSAQLNSSRSSVETKSETRRIVAIALREATRRREPRVPPGTVKADSMGRQADDEIVFFDIPAHMSRTTFGAGSFGLGALGANASNYRNWQT